MTDTRTAPIPTVIPIARPIIGDAEKAAVLAVLESGQLAQGPRVVEFEAAFGARCGVDHAVATSSGTTALHLALLAHNIGPGDEVITSPFSFVASANVMRFVGATPVFVDIDPADYLLRPDLVRARITPRTRAIMPVHLYGQVCDMAALAALATEHGLAVIEDASQAHDARAVDADGVERPAGSFGTGCFSFYPTKNMTTAEGGMLTTEDPAVADQTRRLRQHGASRRYYHEQLGYNFRLTELQAAIGLAQLPRLTEWTERRRANAATLTAGLAGHPFVDAPVERPGRYHVFHQYTVRVRGDRDAAAAALRARGVETSVHYPLPIHRQPLYLEEFAAESYPEAERAAREVLSLPVHPLLSDDDLRRIVEAVWAL